jgi:hypothetical protein
MVKVEDIPTVLNTMESEEETKKQKEVEHPF